MANIKILNLEDNVFKHQDIRRVLKNKYGEIEIDWARNLEEGIDQIAKQAYDIIITDMYFPARAGEEDSNSGEILIRKIKDMNIHTPIILCSSADYRCIPDVVGTVYYHPEKLWEIELCNLIDKIS